MWICSYALEISSFTWKFAQATSFQIVSWSGYGVTSFMVFSSCFLVLITMHNSLSFLQTQSIKQLMEHLLIPTNCKGNLTNLRRELHLSLAKGDPKRTLQGPLARSVYNNIQRNAVPGLLVPSLPYMAVHMMVEGAVTSHGPVPMCPKSIRCCWGMSGWGRGKSTTIGESTSGKSSDHWA
jgi:hypothetical protein